jgi:ferredoxin-NADP reductase
MSSHTVKVKSTGKVTRDVLQIVTQKPEDFAFTPGQATEVSINKNGWEKEGRPFTFTSLPSDDFLQFTIKTYPERKGVTNELLSLKANDELILTDIFGDIEYKGEGIFIAGGAGITPFISIFRYLKSKNELGGNMLLFANKTKADIILREEFEKMLGDRFVNILSDEKTGGYAHGFITKDFLKANIDDFSKPFYLCGPPPMMEAVLKLLENLEVSKESVVMDAF